jgi:hypothetical protein
MKIIKKTDNLLIIKDKDIVFGYIVPLFLLFLSFLIVSGAKNPENESILINYSFAIGAILLGVYLFLSNQTSTIIFDKENKKVQIINKSYFKDKKIEYPFDDIKEIEFGAKVVRRNARPVLFETLYLVFKNNQAIPIGKAQTGFQSSVSGFNLSRLFSNEKSSKKYIGIEIANFLQVPFQERRPPTTGEILSTLKDFLSEQAEIYRNKKEQQKDQDNKE